MDMTTTTSPDSENDTPPETQSLKPLSFSDTVTNGGPKKHHHHHQPPLPVVTYRECLKNHAARIGGHALDGCGEFMPSPAATPADPTSLKCAVCGCHRNFHRQESDDPAATPNFLSFRHHLPPLRRNSPSPPPTSLPPPPNYPHPPHMFLTLSTAAQDDHHPTISHPYHHPMVATPATPTAAKGENPNGRKRFRTKFSQEQKDKLHSFSEKLNWRMQGSDELMVEEFCRDIGISKNVFKVWMHNNKNTIGKKETVIGTNNTTAAVVAAIAAANNRISGGDNTDNGDNVSINNNNCTSHSAVHLQISTNGSSSSS